MTPPAVPLTVYVTGDHGARVAFSVRETAELLGVSRRSVERAIDDGLLEVVRWGDRIVRIPSWSIDRFVRGENAAIAESSGMVRDVGLAS